ncbi:MAG: hypothetical protein LBT46_02800 [Planctomycetaceae bacterium]|nr:hypothetical protein [Planctomycetaceae bacterium]
MAKLIDKTTGSESLLATQAWVNTRLAELGFVGGGGEECGCSDEAMSEQDVDNLVDDIFSNK